MKNIKIWFRVFLLIMIVGFSSIGCVTKGLWDKSSSSSYQDTIIAFYSNPQKNEIIFLGNRYHYLFNEGTVALNELLKAREFLGLQKNNLNIHTYIDRDALAHSSISMTFNLQNISKQQREWLYRHKFLKMGNTPLVTKTFELKGERYRASATVNQHAVKIKYPIEIDVVEYSSNLGEKVLMTPLAVGADAVLIVAGVILSPLVWFLN